MSVSPTIRIIRTMDSALPACPCSIVLQHSMQHLCSFPDKWSNNGILDEEEEKVSAPGGAFAHTL